MFAVLVFSDLSSSEAFFFCVLFNYELWPSEYFDVFGESLQRQVLIA